MTFFTEKHTDQHVIYNNVNVLCVTSFTADYTPPLPIQMHNPSYLDVAGLCVRGPDFSSGDK